MSFNFDTQIDRRGTGCIKWDRREPFGGKEVLPFWIADMDFPSPPGVTEALRNRITHPIYGYTILQDSLLQVVMEWGKNRHRWRTEQKWLLAAPGVVPSISMAILALTEPGDGIIIQPPVYPFFAKCITSNNRQIVENPLKKVNDRYVLDFNDLEKKITPRTKMLILCSPHNPVGRVWTKGELSRLSEICLCHGIMIISDEIHCDLVFSGHKHIPLASLDLASAQNTITLIAPSKTFNLAGTATSFVIISDQVKRERFVKIRDALAVGFGNLFGFIAAEAAYREGEVWLDSLLPYLESNADYLVEYMKKNIPGVTIIKPEGTYLGWLDFQEVIADSGKLQSVLVDQAKVGLSKGVDFGTGGAGCARINFACPRLLLEEGLNRIKNAIIQQSI